MSRTILLFGNTPQLSWSECQSVYRGSQLLSPHIALATNADPHEIIDILGGTILVAIPIEPAIDNLVLAIAESVERLQGNYYAVVDPDHILADSHALLSEIKKLLHGMGIRSRYKAGIDSAAAPVAEKEKIIEFLVYRHEETVKLGLVSYHHKFRDWIKRDREKPYIAPRAGMLPPKVARMVVNIALSYEASGKVLYDPFCGTGSILIEALMRGAKVVGSDIDSNAVNRSLGNLEWLSKSYQIDFKSKIFISDATHVSEKIEKNSIDAIVTEPFLGSPRIAIRKVNPEKIRNINRGLSKLYLGCLHDWTSILKKDAVVMMAFPRFPLGNREYSQKRVIDSLDTLGYTKVLGPLTYAKEDASVIRDFYLLKKI